MVISAIIVVFIILFIIGFRKSKYTVLKVFLGMAAFINILVLFLFASFLYVTTYKITEVDVRKSPDGEYELFLQEVGEPDWPFGSTHAQLMLKSIDNKKMILKYPVDISNDGCRLGAGQWSVTWKENGVEVILSGDEQRDHQFFLGYDGKTESCYLDTRYGEGIENDLTESVIQNQYSEESISEEEFIKDESIEEVSTKKESTKEDSIDQDGYPLSDEWQGYKLELCEIAQMILGNFYSNSEIEYHLTAKGNPYVVIFRQIDEINGIRTERWLQLNESYHGETGHEYVLQEYTFDRDGREILSPQIINFYLIECTSMEITDEQTNQWH